MCVVEEKAYVTEVREDKVRVILEEDWKAEFKNKRRNKALCFLLFFKALF